MVGGVLIVDKPGILRHCDGVSGRLIRIGALAISVAIVIACVPQGLSGPTPMSRSIPENREGIATPTQAAPATLAPRDAPPTTAPTANPTAAGPCPPVTGGTGGQAQLIDLRIAHQPGFDRIVFELGPSTAPGPSGMPSYRIEPAGSFIGVSGQPVPVNGNAFLSVRFQNTSSRHPSTGQATYPGSYNLQPSTPLVRQVKLVEDFERTMVWGVGLDYPVCPTVSVLSSPLRLVVDLPTPP